jgi:preprotein translocase subunit YajC
MIHLLLVVAQEPPSSVASGDVAATGSGSPLVTILPLLLIFGAMYFLLIRPQRRRMRDQQSLLNKIEEGDEILTSGGIYGFVTAIDGDVLWVEVDSEKGIEMRIHRSAVTRKVNPATEPAGGEPVVADTDGEADADEVVDGEKKNKK